MKASITIEGIKFVIDSGFVKVEILLGGVALWSLLTICSDSDIQSKYEPSFFGYRPHITGFRGTTSRKSRKNIVRHLL